MADTQESVGRSVVAFAMGYLPATMTRRWAAC
jgi:hypothetical protein